MSKIAFVLGAVALGSVALPARATGTVDVNYVEPQKFADIGHGSYDRERTLKSLTSYLQDLSRRLPDGQTLRLDITDVDLAGEIYPLSRGDVRVMRGMADWPVITLRYTLLEGGRTLKQGQARIADMNYLGTLNTDGRGELSHERHMLRKWFDETITTAPH